jgi:molybdenum cofactor guanylyltransferase
MKSKPQKLLAAIILAGGKSTRMGQDKALLTINNCSLLTHVCTVAQDSLNWVYVVTPWVVKYRDLIPPQVQLIEEKIVLPDRESNCPLIGFYQGLQQVTTEWILLLACDLPKLNSEAIQQWCQHLTTVTDSEIALLPKSEKGWEPLCGFYRRSCLPLIEVYLNDGGKSFQQWLAQYPIRELPISDRSVLFNCNTWEDWLKVRMMNEER